jgi:hypothetical protein
MKNQTAVEWLQEAMSKKLSSEIGPYFSDLFEQAKEIEKKQIIAANEDCSTNELGELLTGEQYYTSTFGS